MLVLVAIFDFGLGLFSQMTVINSAREGARVGIVDATDSSGMCAQAQGVSTGLDLTHWTCSVLCRDAHAAGNPVIQCSATASGDIVEVTVSYQYHMIIPLAGLLQITSGNGGSPNVLPLSSTVSMRIE
jgi:hypothetical protein